MVRRWVVKDGMGVFMATSVFKAVVRGKLVGTVETRNVFYVQVEPNASQGDEIATWLESVYSPILAATSTLWVAYGLDIYILQAGHWVLSEERAFNHAGSGQGDFTMYQAAAVIVGRTIVPRCLPKKFFAGMLEGNITNGYMIAGLVLSMITAGAAWITPFTGITSQAEYIPGTYSEKHEAFIAFVGCLVNNCLGTQRRRKPGGGV